MSGPDDIFATTRWTQVREAQGAGTLAGTALSDLCAAYYAPVHAYISRTVYDLGDPRDLTQEFFSRVLAGTVRLGGAEAARGRFRAYLLGAVKHFLADTRDRAAAVKRGGRHDHVPLAAGGTDTSPGLEVAAPDDPPPDAWFDREWGLAVLALALEALEAEHARQGKEAHFRVLKPWLTGDGAGGSQTAAAAELGMNEGAVKVAIHRLRRRFREQVKAEIAQTVATPQEAEEELRYLIEAVS